VDDYFTVGLALECSTIGIEPRRLGGANSWGGILYYEAHRLGIETDYNNW
jgi:hypothetical protein